MKARVGDRLVRGGGDTRRACEIIGLHHADGSPPYVVRWLSDGHIALLYPGPYTRLVRRPADPPERQAAPASGGKGGGEPASGGKGGGEPASGGKGGGEPASGRAKPARASGTVRHWPGNPFLPRSIAAPRPAGAA